MDANGGRWGRGTEGSAATASGRGGPVGDRRTRAPGWIAALCVLGLAGAATAHAASGVVRRSVRATEAAWQGAYTNDSRFPQRLSIYASGDWSYEPRSACSWAGVPWSDALRLQAPQLLVPSCNPWAVVGKMEVDGATSTFCLEGHDHFVMPAGATVTFGINELSGKHADNTGTVQLEVVVLELAPVALGAPTGADELALDLPAR